MKICVVSDFHCRHDSGQGAFSDTLLYSNMPRMPISQHPVMSMLKVIEEESISCDYLICLGDLGDKSDNQGITSAWGFVQEIGIKIKSKINIGIAGNHDIDSRNEDSAKAFDYVKNFHENFPTQNYNSNSYFWEKGFVLYEHDENLFLLINTVHDHRTKDKAEKSNITAVQLENIDSELEKLKNKGIKKKICLMHHHPIKHSNILNFKDSDSIENGDKLLDLLCKHNFDIVLHGHKHQPRILNYNGLIVFASGSFSSISNLQSTGLNTMFHIVELEKDEKKGIVLSWEYNIKDGWRKAYNLSFPREIGFGAQCDLNEIAEYVNDKFIENNKPILFKDVLKVYPDLKFLLPDRLKEFGTILKSRFKIETEPELPLKPAIFTD